MLIRHMTSEDIKEVSLIENECFSMPWSEKSFLDSIKRLDTIFLVCVDTNCEKQKVIGYIGMYLSFDEGEITNVAVLTEYRQKGIGKALIEGIKEIALQRQIEKIFLEVRVSNIPAITLYQKNGFQRIGIRKNFYEKPTEDANIMICEL